MSLNVPNDRCYSFEKALAIAQDAMHLNNINYHFRILTRDDTSSLHTVVCEINHHHEQHSFMGGGSGLITQAQVKSLYEALEETFTYQAFKSPRSDLIHFFTTLTSPSLSYLEKNELLPAMLRQSDYLENPYPWIELSSLQAPEEKLYYPLGLVYPYTHFFSQYNTYVPQHELTSITNGTGIAIGASRQEAILHGIHEWIERDAYALFLLTTIMKPAKKARFLNKDSLPQQFRHHVRSIEKAQGDNLIIVDMTNDIDIPAFLVSFTQQPYSVQPSGMGASFDKQTALEQALLEALQAQERYNENSIKMREDAIQHYKQYPLLVKAIKCNLLNLQQSNQYTLVTWDDVATHQPCKTITDQLNHLDQLLKQKNCSIYFTTLSEQPNGLTLAYVLITGLETFFLIRDGLYTPIKKRGRMALTCK